MNRAAVEGAGPAVVSGWFVDQRPLLGLTGVQEVDWLAQHLDAAAGRVPAVGPGREELSVKLVDRLKQASGTARDRSRWRLTVSEETRMRAASAGLWALVSLAAVGGVTALLRPPAGAPSEPLATAPASSVSDAWAAASFGERFVVAYLTAGPDSDADLGAFMAETPDLPATQPPPLLDGPALAVGVEQLDTRYWAVTIASGDPGVERFWWVGVVRDGSRLVATALPTPIAAPAVGERPELLVGQSETPPVGDPAVETFGGWVAAYACGQGDASRYLAPGVSVAPVAPPVCSEARLEVWGSVADDEDRRHVMAEVLLDPGPTARRVSFAAVLAQRAGRWEITELLPAPALASEQEAAR